MHTLPVSQVEAAAIGDVASAETFTKLCRQSVSQQGQQGIPIGGPLVTLLFKLNDMPTNLKIGVHLHQINTTGNRGASGLNQRADVGKQCGLGVVCGGNVRRFLHGGS